jgi:lipooligosaccharide transport system permease protein
MNVTRHLLLSWQLVLRNIAFQRTAWVALVTAFLEPVFYFVAVVVGFGYVIGVSGPHDYVVFVGPALFAVSVMNGSIVECTNNVFYRLRQAKLHDTIICTEMSPVDVTLGELMYGTLRGVAYGAAFLLLLGPSVGVSLWTVIASLVAAVSIGWMFAAIGLTLVSRITKWRQLEGVQLAVFLMFLFSTTFVDTSGRNAVLDIVTYLFPLTYANELMRAVMAEQWLSAAFQLSIVVGLAAVFTVLAIRLMTRELSD